MHLVIYAELLPHRFCRFHDLGKHVTSEHIHAIQLELDHVFRCELVALLDAFSDQLVDPDAAPCGHGRSPKVVACMVSGLPIVSV